MSQSSTVQCALCEHAGHILIPHLRDEHELTARAYSQQFPNSPLFSAKGGALLASELAEARQHARDRPYTMQAIETVFPDHDVFSGAESECKVFTDLAPWVPQGSDDGYVYDGIATIGLLYALDRPKRNATWIAGYSGTGKTQLVHHVCRRVKRELVRVTLDSSITRSDLIGDWVVRDGQTSFAYGIVPQAMQRGSVLLLDEFDMANPYVVALFRPLLEDDPRLIVLENGGEVITPHPDFRLVATANSFGNGDSTGLYGTTQTLSLADRQRFSIFLEMKFLSAFAERNMLLKAVEELTDEDAKAIVQVATAIRREFRRGTVEESISPRQLVNLAETYVDTQDILQAAKMTFMRPLTEATQIAVTTLLAEAGFSVSDVEQEDEA